MNPVPQKLPDICRKHNVRELYVFGRRAAEIAALTRNQPLPHPPTDADVDIGVFPESSTPWNPEEKINLAIEFEDLFEAKRVDLVYMPGADPFLCADIIAGELLFTSDPDEQARYELYVLRRAGDLMPFKKARTRMILEEGAR